MWIESIDLDDFGHFDRARVSGLGDGLTVIAGPQRAGKTTFMEAVRYLGYGLTSGTNVPPATDRYDVAATVVNDGFRYELALDGYAAPSVTKLDDGAPDRTARELFGNVRKTQYQQLYTVSLDELSREPDGLDDGVDLSNVLLEAASGGNITDVPDIRDDFAETARGIGGKHGRKSYELKGPLATIQEGVEERDAATDQVADYEKTEAETRAIDDRIAEIEAEIDAREAEQTRLEAVITGHETYRELQECSAKLDANDVEDVDSFPVDRLDEATSMQEQLQSEQRALRDVERSFESTVVSTVDSPDPGRYRARLVEARSSIERFEHEQSGWEERAETLRDRAETLEATRQRIEETAADLGPDWDGDPLETIRGLDADLFSRDAVDQAVDRYQTAEAEVTKLSQDVDELSGRRDDLDARIEEAVEMDGGTSARNVVPVAAVGSILALVAGGALAVSVDPLVGVAVTTLVLLVTGGYAFSRTDSETPKHGDVSVDTLRAEVDKVETELEAKRRRLHEAEDDLAAAETTLDELRATYDLPEAVSAAAVGQFHDGLVDLKGELAAYEADRDRFEESVAGLRSDLETVVETLADVGVLEESIEDPVDDVSEVFAAIERAVDHLDLAADVQQANRSLRDVEKAVVAALREWEETASSTVEDDDLVDELDRFVEHGERVREYRARRDERDEARDDLLNQLGVQTYAEALEPVVERGEDEDEESDWLIDAYETVLGEHGSIDGVEARRDAVESAIEELETEKDSCVDERSGFERELRDLASDTEVRDAHETIERGRRELEPLAEEYATHRIAEYLLDELHERFIERTTGPLLDEASDIFKRITGDAYVRIDTRDEFDDLDFEAVLEDGGVHRTSELSRATAEQLFLAVRLARIKRYEEPLPVLLDDSLTNFDPGHVQRTLDVVCELADDVQVFLLTCHPTLADRVADAYDAQYWCLDDGAFDGPHWTNEPVRDVFERGEPGSRARRNS